MPLYSPQHMIYSFLLSLVAGFPLLLLIGCCFPALRTSSYRLLPFAPLPALLAVLFSDPGIEVQVPWFFMGGSMGLDKTGRIFLSLTAFIWLFSALAVYKKFRSDPYRFRFAGFFLTSMSGNFGLILARDILGFYLFFALMSFSAYGLIVHRGTLQALKAGRIYLILVLLSELTMFVALVILAGNGTVPVVGAILADDIHLLLIVLLFITFGVKVGALPFQSWMILSYQEIPVPAAIALAGAMINAGILGWMRFIPFGHAILPSLGVLFILLGATAAIYGVVFGLYQEKIGRVLASSSISQMGLLTLIAGYGLMSPDAGRPALLVMTLFAVHHSMAKASLFLGYDMIDRKKKMNTAILLTGLLLPSLALAGLPLTSGAMVKGVIKDLAELENSWWHLFGKIFLPASSIGTTILMLHCVRLMKLQSREALTNQKNFSAILWLISVIGVMFLPWLWPPLRYPGSHASGSYDLLHTLWPVVLGSALALVWFASGNRLPGRGQEVADFDSITRSLYDRFMSLLNWFTDMLERMRQKTQPEKLKQHFVPFYARLKGPGKWEKVLGRWSVVGLCYLLVCILLFLIIMSDYIATAGL